MIKFRAYSQDQGLALPPYLDELIEDRHLVRVVNQVVSELDIQLLSKPFKGSKHQLGGAPPLSSRDDVEGDYLFICLWHTFMS